MRLVHAPRLAELYLGALEESFEVKPRLGWHARLIPELTELTGSYPLRERLTRQLMIALYRSRRSAEALTHYGRIRDRLVEEFGVEPGAELRRLHESILREDLTLSVPFVRITADPAAGRAPAELPPPIAAFAGEITQAAAARLTGWPHPLVNRLSRSSSTRSCCTAQPRAATPTTALWAYCGVTPA